MGVLVAHVRMYVTALAGRVVAVLALVRLRTAVSTHVYLWEIWKIHDVFRDAKSVSQSTTHG